MSTGSEEQRDCTINQYDTASHNKKVILLLLGINLECVNISVDINLRMLIGKVTVIIYGDCC